MSSPTFIPLPNRDASSTIRGFLYQIELTIKSWIEADDSTILELERGEDIDIIQKAWTNQEIRTLEQIKLRSASLSLRSPEALEALVNFWLSHSANPGLNLRFRYLTNAQPAVERDVDFHGGRGGVEVWNDYSLGHLSPSDADKFKDAVCKFLLKLKRPDKVRPEDWKAFRSFLRTESAEIPKFAARIEWSYGNPQAIGVAADIEAKLLKTGYLGQLDVAKAHSQLLSFVIRRITSPGVKRLTNEELRAELRDIEKSTVNPALVGMINTLLQQDSDAQQLERNLLQAINSVGQTVGRGELPKISPGLPSLISVLPAPIFGGTQRDENVSKLVQALDQASWIGLYGDSGSGKTQLARLLTDRVSVPLWLSFRNTGNEQTSSVFDSYIASVSKVVAGSDLREWYLNVCTRLPRGATFFLDDLPFDGNAEVCTKVAILAECAAKRGIKIVSTTADKIAPTPGEKLGSYFFEIPVPRFSDDEIKEYLLNLGAPESLLLKPGFFAIVDSVTRRNPQVISAFARYMQERAWNYDEMTIAGVLRGDFAEDLRTQTRRILMATVPEATRELLYRLNVIGPVITSNDAANVGKLPPPISLPIEKLSGCVGAWVQRFTSDAFLMSPLVEQIGIADIPVDMQKLIHRDKAQSILSKRTLNQFDALAAIRHFSAAGENREAAQVLFVSLSALNEQNSRAVEDFGLLDVWTNIELPTDVPIGVQLVIRALQISARKRHGKSFSNVQRRFDDLFEKAVASDPLAAFGTSVMIAMALADEDVRRAAGYATSALRLEHRATASLPRGWGAQIADIIWATIGPHLQGPDDLVAVLKGVAQLSQKQIRRTFASDMAAQSCRFILDRFWTREADKTRPQWQPLLDRLAEIESIAKQFEAHVLLAAVARAQIAVKADYQKDLASAIAIARRASEQVKTDPRALFLIAFTAGVSSCGAGAWSEGFEWLTKTIDLNEYLYPDFYARALLYLAQGRKHTGGSARADCALAVEFCRTHGKVSELMLVRSLGEYSISLWEEGDEPAFFEAWQETIERVLAGRAQNDDWKQVFVLTGNNTGWFAAGEKGLAPVRNMTKPFQGIYLRDISRVTDLYAPETEWYMPASMVWIAEKLGHYAESSRWALRATEMAAGSPLGAQANTLLMYAGPQSIRQRRYAEALAFASRAIAARQAPIDALKAFAEKRGDEEFTKIIEERPQPRPGLGAEFVTVMMVPILIDLLILLNTDTNAGREFVTSVMATCEELAANDDQRDAWLTAHETLDHIFSPEANLDSIVTAGIQHSKEYKYLPAVIYALGTAVVGNPNSVCFHWLTALEFYERQFAASRLHIQLVAVLVNSYWKHMASISSFAFRQPTLLLTKLEEFERRQDLLPRHVMRVVVWHLGLEVPREAKEWLEKA